MRQNENFWYMSAGGKRLLTTWYAYGIDHLIFIEKVADGLKEPAED